MERTLEEIYTLTRHNGSVGDKTYIDPSMRRHTSLARAHGRFQRQLTGTARRLAGSPAKTQRGDVTI